MIRLMLLARAELSRAGQQLLGMGPANLGLSPLPAKVFVITGQTTDSAGVTPVPGCAVHLFRTADDLEIDQTVSDGSGNFEFRCVGWAQDYYCVSYLPGSPDLAGTTVNTIKGV